MSPTREARAWAIEAKHLTEPADDDDGMCECELEPTIGELETGRCSCCGRPIYPQPE